MIYQIKSRLKSVILFFMIMFICAGIGIYFYAFRQKEPTHGIFVYETNYQVKGEQVVGYIYKPSKEDYCY